MSKTTKLSLVAITGFVMLVSTGCQMVHVQDQTGNPVNWAAVSTGVEGQKTSSLPTMTDLFGNVALAKSMTKEREIIQVSKDGYETVTVPRSLEDKVTIKLQKIGTPTKPATAKSGNYTRPKSSNVQIPAPADNKPIDTRIPPKTN